MKRLFSYLLFSLSCLMSFGQTKEEAIPFQLVEEMQIPT